MERRVPKLNRNEYSARSKYDFLNFIVEQYGKQFEADTKLPKSINLLYVWCYFEFTLESYGIVNWYHTYEAGEIPFLIEEFEVINFSEMVRYLKESQSLYKKFQDQFTDLKRTSVSDDRYSEIYDDLEQRFQALYPFYPKEDPYEFVERHIRQHPDEYCIDENGNSFLLYHT